MENKIINAINHIKFIIKNKLSIDHILENLRKSLEIERLMASLSDMVTNNLQKVL